MKIFDGMQSFFNSLGEYVKNFSNLFWIFLGAFLLVSVVIIIVTSFAYECKLTKTIDKINKFLERNHRINDDNLVAFNNLMKASSVPKTLRRQWQQFMLYREHPASYYMSFKHCVENPLRNSTYNQQMTVYKIISYVLVALSLVVSTFMAVQSFNSNLVLQDIVIIPITILVLYWLISMVLNLVHSAISGDLFQNYQYFEINMDKAMLTLPEFVDYEVLFSQDEIKRGIPVLFAYLQKRAIQEQQELEKARLKSVDHEKFDFDKAGLDGSLVLDRAMRETENYTTQRKKYMQEIERVNNEISVLENNYREQTKEFQRQVQTSKETVENLKEQLEQATSTIEINYIKKQMRDEINRQQLAEKDFDILTDKHNQEIKSLNQEIKRYEEEIKKAKEAMEVAMLSEFNTYSVKVYDNLEKIVDEKMQDRVDDYKDQIKGLEVELEEKNEELENVYTRYQEALAQIPSEPEPVAEEIVDELPIKKGKKKKKSHKDTPIDDGVTQPEQVDYEAPAQEYQEYGDYNYENPQEQYDNQEYAPVENQEYVAENSEYNQDAGDYGYVPMDSEQEYNPVDNEYAPIDDFQTDYVPMDEEQTYVPENEDAYVPMDENGYDNNVSNEEYIPLDDNQNSEYIPMDDYSQDGFVNGEYVPMDEQGYAPAEETYVPADENVSEEVEPETTKDEVNAEDMEVEEFDDADFDIDFAKSAKINDNFEDMSFDFDLGLDDNKTDTKPDPIETILPEEDEGEFDLHKALGLYDTIDETKVEEPKPTLDESEPQVENEVESAKTEVNTQATDANDEVVEDTLPQPAKRKAGRPRKIVDESEIEPKRKVGRPKKVVDAEQEEAKPKRKAGRPKKIVDEAETTKRKVGRPKKVVTETEAEPKRKVGRPKKVEAENAQVEVVNVASKKVGRGRPRKDTSTSEVVEQSKRRGRPKKDETATKEVVKTETSKRGRPKKQQTETTESVVDEQGILNKPKRKAGRPKKGEN